MRSSRDNQCWFQTGEHTLSEYIQNTPVYHSCVLHNQQSSHSVTSIHLHHHCHYERPHIITQVPQCILLSSPTSWVAHTQAEHTYHLYELSKPHHELSIASCTSRLRRSNKHASQVSHPRAQYPNPQGNTIIGDRAATTPIPLSIHQQSRHYSIPPSQPIPPDVIIHCILSPRYILTHHFLPVVRLFMW